MCRILMNIIDQRAKGIVSLCLTEFACQTYRACSRQLREYSKEIAAQFSDFPILIWAHIL